LGRVLLFFAASMVAGLLLCWGRLSGPWRRRVALVVSAAGLVFLFLALNTAGEREATTTGAFIIGSRYVTGKAQASASLPYYVMTGACLLLGTAGLAVPNPTARRLAEHWLATAIGLSLLVSLVRYLLELAAAPEVWTWIVGLWALPPVVGAFFLWSLGAVPRQWRSVSLALLQYAVVVRTWVAALYITATVFHLGSHYDLSSVVSLRNPFSGSVTLLAPGSLRHLLNLAILPQMVFWPVYTLLTGLLGAAVFRLAARGRGWSAEGNLPAPTALSPVKQG
jgi:hypothetical protein